MFARILKRLGCPHGAAPDTAQLAPVNTPSDLSTASPSGLSSIVRAQPRSSPLPPRSSHRLPAAKYRVLAVGFGPRTSTQLRALVTFLEAHKDDFDKLAKLSGKPFTIQYLGVERQSSRFLGRGHGWGPNQGWGTVNSGVETVGEDKSAGLLAYVEKNREQLKAAYRDHPVLDALFTSAFPPNKAPRLEAAALGRRQQGAEEHHQLRNALHKAGELPFLKVKVLTHTSVEAIDLSDPKKPAVNILNRVTGRTDRIQSNTVRLNSGWTMDVPKGVQAPVQLHSFIRLMDNVALTRWLGDKGLLDEHHQLKPGKRLALGGAGLSAMDTLLALQDTMKLFERDLAAPTGYRVTDEAKQKYQGALTFISRSPGWIPPRHAHSPQWTQKTKGLGTTRMLHSAFLHRQGQAVFTDWPDVIRGSVAQACGMTPTQVRGRGLDTKQWLTEYHHANLAHLAARDTGNDDEAAQTMPGAMRQASLATILGFGMERDLAQAQHDMERDAPLSFKGRTGYRFHRAQVAGISTIDNGGQLPENNDLLKSHRELMDYVTASPALVQEAAYLLEEAGIAKQVISDYSNLEVSPYGSARPLRLASAPPGTADFDAFLVPPTQRRNAEPAVASLADQVQPVHPSLPDLGKVTTNRRIVAKNGEPSHVEDFSLNGKGERIGGRSTVGIFATDLNNRESATDVMYAIAARDAAIAVLTQAGFEDPTGTLDVLYEAHKPTPDAFDAEVKQFAPDFRQLQIQAALVRSADQAARGDPKVFSQVINQGQVLGRAHNEITVRARGAMLEPLLQAKFDKIRGVAPDNNGATTKASGLQEPSAAFADAISQLEPFSPTDLDEFLSRFVDLPADVHEAVYQTALKLALEKVSGADSLR